ASKWNPDANGTTVPGATDHAIFSRWSPTSYTVSLAGGTTSNDRLSVRQTGIASGTTPSVVTFSIPSGATWSLTNTGDGSGTNPASLMIAEFQGVASVAVTGGGTLQTQSAVIARQAGGTGALTVTGSGTTWLNAGSVRLGGSAIGGTGTLTVNASAAATVSGTLQVNNTAS